MDVAPPHPDEQSSPTESEPVTARRPRRGRRHAHARHHRTSPSTAPSVQQVSDLKEQDGLDIVLTGSITLAHAMIEAGLVDEYRLFGYPAVQGRGRRLFRTVTRCPACVCWSPGLSAAGSPSRATHRPDRSPARPLLIGPARFPQISPRRRLRAASPPARRTGCWRSGDRGCLGRSLGRGRPRRRNSAGTTRTCPA